MNVKNVEITDSPWMRDRTCIRADVICNDKEIPPEIYWIDVPRAYSDSLSTSGNTWLALLLPFAVRLGESLTISEPVDRDLVHNAYELMRVWNCWHPHLKPVPIEADIQENPAEPSAGATAALFSGGVDSWFTLLRYNGEHNQPGRVHIDDLLRVLGLDIPLEDAGESRALHDALVHATSGLETRYVEVATNLRQTRWWAVTDWARISHGSAFAGIGHALSGRYSEVLIPATHRYDRLVPWGTHPLTDPLLSSARTKFTHDGAGFNRVEKTEALAKSKAALNSLQVCWNTGGYRNCGRCSKCYLTMTTLFLLGALDQCSRFNGDRIENGMLSKMFTGDASSRAFLRDVHGLAVRTGNHEIARAINRSFRRSRRLKLGMRASKLPLRMAGTKWRRRLDRQIERLFLRNSIV